MTPSRLAGFVFLLCSTIIALDRPAYAGLLDPSIPTLSQVTDGVDDVRDDIVGEALSIKNFPTNNQIHLQKMRSDQADYEIAYRALSSAVNHYYRDLESAVTKHKHINMDQYDAYKKKIISAANKEQSLGDAFITTYKSQGAVAAQRTKVLSLLNIVLPGTFDPIVIWKNIHAMSDPDRQALAKEIASAEWPQWDDLSPAQGHPH